MNNLTMHVYSLYSTHPFRCIDKCQTEKKLLILQKLFKKKNKCHKIWDEFLSIVKPDYYMFAFVFDSIKQAVSSFIIQFNQF